MKHLNLLSKILILTVFTSLSISAKAKENPSLNHIEVNDINYESKAKNLNQSFGENTAKDGFSFNSEDTETDWAFLNRDFAPSRIAKSQNYMVSSSLQFSNREFTPNTEVSDIDESFFMESSSDQNEFVEIKMLSTGNSYSTFVYFHENASEGLDIGYDAAIIFSIPDFCLYTHLLQDNEGLPFVIQTLNSSAYDDVNVPLGVSANQGQEITFTLEDSYMPESVFIYLEDVWTGTFTLLNSSDYTFTSTSPLSGTGRFFLRFTTEILDTLSIENSELNNINIYSSVRDRNIVIEGALKNKTKATIYDITGRVAMKEQLDASFQRHELPTHKLRPGIYVVTLQQGNSQITQKVVLK